MWPFSPFSSVADPWTGRRNGVHLAKPGKLKIGANVKPSREAESSPSFDAAGLHGIVMGSSLDDLRIYEETFLHCGLAIPGKNSLLSRTFVSPMSPGIMALLS